MAFEVIFKEFENWISLPAVKPRREDEQTLNESPRLKALQGQEALPEMLNKLYVEANAVWRNMDLSPQGRIAGLQKLVGEFVVKLQRFKVEYLDSTVTVANGLYRELMSKIDSLKADPTNVPQALLRSEIRHYLQNKNPFERLTLFRTRVIEAQDTEFLQAVKEGGFLELIDPKYIQSAAHHLAIRQQPQLAQRYFDTKEAAERLGMSLFRIVEVLNPHAGQALSVPKVELPEIDMHGEELKRLVAEAIEKEKETAD